MQYVIERCTHVAQRGGGFNGRVSRSQGNGGLAPYSLHNTPAKPLFRVLRYAIKIGRTSNFQAGTACIEYKYIHFSGRAATAIFRSALVESDGRKFINGATATR